MNYIGGLFVILAVGCLLVFYKFIEIPVHLAYDEVSFTRLALSLDHQPYTPYSTLATGHSTLYFYIILASLKLFGVSTFALRLPAALFGIGSAAVVYVLFQKLLGKTRYALIAGLTLLSMRWFLNFSRFSFEATFLIFLELLSMTFLVHALQKKKWYYVLACSIFAGLSYLSYYPGRIFFLLPLISIGLTLHKKMLLFFIAVFVVIITPLTLYNASHPDIRIGQLSILQDKHLKPADKVKAVRQNIEKTIYMFLWKGDMNGRHNFPGKAALNPIMALLFIMGMIIVMRNRGTQADTLFLIWFFISLLPSLFTSPSDNPNMLRTVTAVPSIVYAISIIFPFVDRIKKHYLVYIVVLLLVASAAYDLRTYFFFQSRVMRNSFEVTCGLPELMKQKTDFVPKQCRVSKNLF